MRQFMYCLQFHGRVRKSSDSAALLATAGRASSCQVRTLLDRHGIESRLEPLPGESADFESEFLFEPDGGFLESGTISFGRDHRLHFSTVGRGHFDGSPDPRFRQGSVIWKIDRGEGQFEGAQGLITSNFLVCEDGEVTDHHFGLIFLQ